MKKCVLSKSKIRIQKGLPIGLKRSGTHIFTVKVWSKKWKDTNRTWSFLKPKVLYIPESWSEGIPASEIGIDAARISSTRRGVIWRVGGSILAAFRSNLMPFAVIIEGDAKLFATFSLIAISLSSPRSRCCRYLFIVMSCLERRGRWWLPGDGAAGDDGMCPSDGPTLHKII